MGAPTIIAGPAIIQHNGQTYYTEGDITLNHNRETFAIVSSLGGEIDTRLISQMVEISFKPVGALDVVAKYLPYALTQIGTFLFTPTALKDVVVWAKDGTKTTWKNGAITKLPAFDLAATKSALGDMTLTVLGDPTKEATDEAAWNAIATEALVDATFDETKIITGRYTAAYGAAPYAAMESEDGFRFEVALKLSAKKVANYGVVNMILSDITAVARFKPVGLTEAQLWTLMSLQGANAILPGQSVTKANKDLVITAAPVSFTLHKAGPISAVTQYGLEPLRFGEVAFAARKTWTTGAVNPLFTIAFA